MTPVTGTSETTMTRGELAAVVVAVIVYLALAVPAIVLLFTEEHVYVGIALILVAHLWTFAFHRWMRARQEERTAGQSPLGEP